MNRKVFLLIPALAIIVGAGILVYINRPKPNPTLKTVTVNQAFEHLLYIGLYVAKDAGFFEKQGLDVRIETGGGDSQAFSALTSGSAQFA